MPLDPNRNIKGAKGQGDGENDLNSTSAGQRK
jgi:hypothetical protein